jgi:hypothetical protein
VLLVTVGGGRDWNVLRNHLMESGWMTIPVEMEPVTERGGPGIDTPRLEGMTFAIFVVGNPETKSNLLATRGLLHYVGFVQGTLGYRRVLVLVEDRVDAFLRGTGVPELTYSAGNIQSRFAQISATLRDLGSSPPKSRFEQWMQRAGLQGTNVASEVWLWAGGLVIAALCVTVLYLIFADPLQARNDPDLVVVVESTTTVAPQSDGVAGPIASTAPPTAGPAAAAPATVPSVNPGALPGATDVQVASLPSTCVVSTLDGEVVASRISCGGNGSLAASGFLGPWHTEITAVTLSQGVVGEAHLEPRAGATSETRVQLNPGQRTELEPYGSGSGTHQLVFEFSANNESVVLHQSEERGGVELVLTFSLDQS